MLFRQYPYLYNCAECSAKVKVKPEGVTRTCNHTTATINAPRRCLLTGDGTLNGVPFKTRLNWHLRRFLTWATGRCI
jgi:hypothetical protein